MLYLFEMMWDWLCTKREKREEKKEDIIEFYHPPQPFCETVYNDDPEYGQYVDISNNYCTHNCKYCHNMLVNH